MRKRIAYLDNRREALSKDRNHMLSHWRRLRAYINPLRGRFNQDTVYQREKPNFEKIITGRSLYARRTLAGGLRSGLTSPSRDWFKLAMGNSDEVSQEAREWLDVVHDRIMRVLGSSNYYEEMHSTYEELAVFGNSALFIEEDYNRILRCQTLTTGSYMVGTDSYGSVNVFYHQRWLTTSQMVDKFGRDKLPKEIKQAYDNDELEKRFSAHNLIEQDKKATDGRYKSIWWADADGGTILGEGFYREFPVMFARWNVLPDMVYGYGPATEALADCMQLMRMQADRLAGVAKQVGPPLIASHSLQGQTLNVAPNSINYAGAEGGDLDKIVLPLYQTQLNLTDLRVAIEEISMAINEGFYVDLFLMIQNAGEAGNTRMTATEIAERRTEKMTALGPVLERLESELLTPSIQRVFSIMLDSGLLPPPPDSMLDGSEIKIEYVSILAQAQQMMGIQPLEQLTQYVATVLASFPEIADKLDWDKIVEHYHTFVGAPADVVKKQEEVDAIRAARAQAMEQQQGLDQMGQAAGSLDQIASGAEQMSNAGEIGNAALSQLMGSMGYGGEGYY